MTVKSEEIASLIQQIQQSYTKKSLSQKNQNDLNKIINEMHLLSIIYEQCSQENRKIIRNQLQEFHKKLKEETATSGGFMGWMSWSQVQIITLDNYWPQITNIKQPECQHLINDIALIKKTVKQ